MSNSTFRTIKADYFHGISGFRNYIHNPFATDNENGVGTYDDNAAIPVNGNGAGYTASFTRSTISPLSGDASFLYTPTANLGQGVYFPFTIDRADFAKVMSIQFDYEIGTFASFTDGDLSVYIISASDSGFTTNVEVTQPVPFRILKASGIESFKSAFQSHVSNTFYRLCFHQTTTATGYTLKIDNIILSAQPVIQGTAITDWQSYTPTVAGFTASGASASSVWKYRFNGDTMEISGAVHLGATGSVSSTITFDLPAGYSVDFTKNTGIDANGNFANYLGVATMFDSSVSRHYIGGISSVGTDNNTFRIVDGNGLGDIWGATVPVTWAANDIFFVNFRAPILGRSSSTIMSSDTDTRVIAFNATRTTNQLIAQATQTPVLFNSVQVDDVNAYDPATGIYTIRVPGRYQINAQIHYDVATSGVSCRLLRNGTLIKSGRLTTVGAFDTVQTPNLILNMTAGETLQVAAFHNTAGTVNINGDGNNNNFSIERLSGPAQIAATESIGCSYYLSAVTATPVTSNVLTTLTSTYCTWTREFDTHGLFTPGTAQGVIPASGIYSFEYSLFWNNTTWTAGASNNTYCAVQINGGTNYYFAEDRPYTNQPYVFITGVRRLRLNAGDTFLIRAFQNSGSNLFPLVSVTHRFSVVRGSF